VVAVVNTLPLATHRVLRTRVAIAAGVPAAALLIAAWDPARNGGPPLCPLSACTGVACPGCGLTRATGALLRGRPVDAVGMHPLVLVIAVQVAVVWFLLAVLRRRIPTPLGAGLLAANAVALVAVWALRLATGDLDSA
jgi:hypothetical protein